MAEELTPWEANRLMRRAGSDPTAYGRLYDHYFPVVFNYLYRRTLDFELANDLASETFLKGYSRLWQFRWRGISPLAWFYRIATNELKMYRRGHHPHTSLDLLRQSGFEPSDPHDFLAEKIRAEEQLQHYQAFLKAREVIRQLPEKYREVLVLRYFERLTVPEISEVLGKKEGTVKSLLSRGLDQIRNQFSDG